MAPDLLTPATDWDMAELAGRCSPHVWALMRLQVAIGSSWVLRDDAGAIAAGGLVPIEGLGVPAFEVWLLIGPRGRRHLAAILRAARLTVMPSADHPIMAKVRTPEGRRIAELLGFRHVVGSPDVMLHERRTG